MRIKIPRALTIAGSDSGGGAGIQADLKTFTALGVHGMTAVTSITAQNTLEVRTIHDIPPAVVAAQIEAVADDIGVDAAKTGMLSNAEIIRAVAATVRKYGFPLVVDPVMIAKSGAKLLRDDAIEALIKELIPLATVVTPNAREAERITGIMVRTLDDARRAAKYIVEELGAKAAVVKGGHLPGTESIDILYHKGSFKEFKARRIDEGCMHGTGCTFSAAIAACLAKGLDVKDSVGIAKRFVTLAIKHGTRVGKGHCPVNPSAWVDIPAERWAALASVARAIEILEENGELINPLVPEVQMNVVTAISGRYANSVEDVAAVKGRIVRYGRTIRAVGPPTFGASSHLARAVLKVMEFDERIRGVINVKYSDEFIQAAKKLGFTCSYYDRSEEPEGVKTVEGGTIPWGVGAAVKRAGGKVPDIIYHTGDVGKEPMINVFGFDAVDVVRKVLKIVEVMRHG